MFVCVAFGHNELVGQVSYSGYKNKEGLSDPVGHVRTEFALMLGD